MTALVAFLVVRERLSRGGACGILLAFAGIFVMISRGDPRLVLDLGVNLGDLVMVVAVVAWASYSVDLHRQAELPSGEILLFFIAAAGVVTVLPFYVAEHYLVRQFAPSWPCAAAIAYVSLTATLLAVYLWNLAIRSVGATHAALFINLLPVFGAAFAMIFLGERLYAFHILGAGLVISGIVIAVRERLRSPGF